MCEADYRFFGFGVFFVCLFIFTFLFTLVATFCQAKEIPFCPKSEDSPFWSQEGVLSLSCAFLCFCGHHLGIPELVAFWRQSQYCSWREVFPAPLPNLDIFFILLTVFGIFIFTIIIDKTGCISVILSFIFSFVLSSLG